MGVKFNVTCVQNLMTAMVCMYVCMYVGTTKLTVNGWEFGRIEPQLPHSNFLGLDNKCVF